MTDEERVQFDPGFSGLASGIPREAALVFDEIAKLKEPHKRKFEFQRFDAQLSEMIKRQAGFYMGCILWGAYLHYRYKNCPRAISGNPMLETSEGEGQKTDSGVDYGAETRFVIELIDKLHKGANYYLRTPSKASRDLIPIFEAYSEFTTVNDNFKHLDATDKIKLPQIAAEIGNYSVQYLEELKDRIYEAINVGKPELLLNTEIL
jgi:hypothetical protein